MAIEFSESPMAKPAAEKTRVFATRDDIKAILGDLDPGKMLAIVELRPTLADVETASLWLAGDADVYDGEPLKGTAAEIVAIVTEGEDEED
jgi:hypothetical protein